MPEINGRVYGYADEVEWFCRNMLNLVVKVHEKRPASRLAFVRKGSPITLGTRGWFTKRVLTQQEYTVYLDSAEQYDTIAPFMRDLADRMS